MTSYGNKNPHLVEAFDGSLESVKTAFDDLNTVQRRTLVDIQSSQGTSILRDIINTTNSGSVTNANSGEILLETGTTSGSEAAIETSQWGQYTSGYIAQTGIGVRIPTQPSNDEYIEWGYFSDTNGFNFGYDATGLYVARLRNGTEVEKVYRDSWNGADPNSLRDNSANFDPSEGVIYQINFAWYGYGAIEFRIVSGRDDEEQKTAVVHRMSVDSETTITNPNQPIRMRVDNRTSANNVQAYVGGRQFSILGESTDNFRITSQNVTNVTASYGSWNHIISMRRKNTDDRRINAEALGFDLTTNRDTRVAVLINPNLSSTSYGSIDLIPDSETMMEQSSAGTFDGIGNGIKIWEGFAYGGSGTNEDTAGEGPLADLRQVIPREQPISIIAQPVGTNDASINTTMRLREEW